MAIQGHCLPLFGGKIFGECSCQIVRCCLKSGKKGRLADFLVLPVEEYALFAVFCIVFLIDPVGKAGLKQQRRDNPGGRVIFISGCVGQNGHHEKIFLCERIQRIEQGIDWTMHNL